MVRVKTGTVRRRKHKKVLKLAKGYRMTRRKLYKSAHEAVLHAGEYAFAGRRLKKRQFRRLWITRLNAATRQHGLKYSQFIRLLKGKKVELDRKILARLAVEYPKVFERVVDFVKK